jgi:hypothetical protein
MSRQTSWLTRLPEIRRSVAESVRSHYERRDIERLFRVRPRSAQQLMKAISVAAKVGRSGLVERQAIENYLAQVAESDDPEKLIQSHRRTVPTIPRKRLHHFIQHDEISATLDTLPPNVKLDPGLLQITFTNIAELAQGLYRLAQAMDADVEDFRKRFGPAQPVIDEDPVEAEIRAAFAELEELERKKALGASEQLP